MFHSIRTRIAVPYIILSLAGMIALTIYLAGFIRQADLQARRSQLTDDAHLVGEAATPLLLEPNAAEALTTLAVRYGGVLAAGITIIGVNGAVLGESLAEGVLGNHLSRPEVQQALSEGSGFRIRQRETLGEQMMYVAVRVDVDGQARGVVRVALSLAAVE